MRVGVLVGWVHRLLIAGAGGALLVSCSGGANDGADSTSLRTAVTAYSDAYLTGDMAAYELLSVRCKSRLPAEQFRSLITGAKSLYGTPLPLRSFKAEISGDLARVTYTFDDSSINQEAEPWTREGGEWHEDDC